MRVGSTEMGKAHVVNLLALAIKFMGIEQGSVKRLRARKPKVNQKKTISITMFTGTIAKKAGDSSLAGFGWAGWLIKKNPLCNLFRGPPESVLSLMSSFRTRESTGSMQIVSPTMTRLILHNLSNKVRAPKKLNNFGSSHMKIPTRPKTSPLLFLIGVPGTKIKGNIA
ncbi:hypothetical protein NQZ79_g8376 [Umbelopsis isabellina]|nr:hypothetical protein NQZ79_g8376 [Umbelopsis isabellina]